MFKILKDFFFKDNIIYYPGCFTKFRLTDIEKNYVEIFNLLNLDILTLDNKVCCGSPVYHAGIMDVFDELNRKKEEYFNQFSFSKLVTNCPSCDLMLKDYKSINFVVFFNDLLVKKKIILRDITSIFGNICTFHDPCHLGKKQNIFDEPRFILKSLGFNLVEMFHNKENSLCCGGGGGVSNISYSKDISLNRVLEAKDVSDILVTSCPMCYYQLKNSVEQNKISLKVYEISELILEALK